jgi:hypothetical protein
MRKILFKLFGSRRLLLGGDAHILAAERPCSISIALSKQQIFFHPIEPL